MALQTYTPPPTPDFPAPPQQDFNFPTPPPNFGTQGQQPAPQQPAPQQPAPQQPAQGISGSSPFTAQELQQIQQEEQQLGIKHTNLQASFNGASQGGDINKLSGNALLSTLGIGPDTSVPGADTAMFPASPAGKGNNDYLKIAPNALKDIGSLLYQGTVGTAQNIAKIPGEAGGLIQDEGGGAMGVLKGAHDLVNSIPDATVQMAWGMVPQSAKELINTNAISQIPDQFKQLAKESGGYGPAFLNAVKALPGAVPEAIKQYADQLDRSRQAFENHPVNEALGYFGLKALVDSPTDAISDTAKAVGKTAEAVAHPIETLKSVAADIKGNPVGLTPEQQTIHDATVRQQAANSYRSIVNPSKGVLQNVEIKNGGDINQAFQRMADEGITIGKTPEGKLDTTGATAQMRAVGSGIHQEMAPILESQPQKQFNLQDLGKQVKDGFGTTVKNASELKTRQAEVDSFINDEIARHGNMVDGKTLDYIKSGMWGQGYDALRPTAKATARLIGNVFKTTLEDTYKGLPIKEFNNLQSQHFQAADILDKSHGNAIKGSTMGKAAAKIGGAVVGGIAGAVTAPFTGPFASGAAVATGAAGMEAAGRISDYMSDPWRQTSQLSSKLKALQTPSESAQILEKGRASLAQPPTFSSGAVPQTVGQEAINTMIKNGGGEVKEAISHPDSEVGKIDLLWGKPTVGNKSGYGLAEIAGKHPEVLPTLEQKIKEAKVVERLPQRLILQTDEKPPFRVVIDQQHGKEKRTFLNNAYIDKRVK